MYYTGNIIKKTLYQCTTEESYIKNCTISMYYTEKYIEILKFTLYQRTTQENYTSYRNNNKNWGNIFLHWNTQ